MKLDLAQMKAITKGVMDVTEENGAFVFHRLNEAQMGIYKPDSVALSGIGAAMGIVAYGL